jgi:hypothetical protein
MNNIGIDVSNALYVWSCLEQAHKRKNPFGGNTAEIYVQHLLPIDYDASLGKPLWIQASKNLYSILTKFCEVNNVKAFVNGQTAGDWMNEYQFLHRCEVRIEAIK